MDALNDLNWGLIAPIIAVQLVLLLVALIMCVRAEATNGPKWLWVVLILFVQIIGPVLFFTIGRRNEA